jgi:3-methyladenine DNA glycosylase AlkD
MAENMVITANRVKQALRKLADPAIAEHAQGFFKTAKGEYGEGDKFLGIRVPTIRQQIKEFKDLTLGETLKLLKSPFHEERLFALLMLVRMFTKTDEDGRMDIYKYYLAHTEFINSWDLVDGSASQIVGAYLHDRDKRVLYDLVRSEDLWERRIAIISTFHAIKCGQFADALKISAMLKNDDEDLIHKAVGWMLREIGKRDVAAEETFLKKHCRDMPRTMLRYAIEKFPAAKRQAYLSGDV